MSIKVIIWDLGGVLVRTENRAPRNALASELGIDPFVLEAIFFGEGLPPDKNPQIGAISATEHIKSACKELGYPVSNWETLRDRFFAGDILDEALVNQIRTLKQDYHIALLSNAFNDLRQSLEQEWKILDAFDTIIISGEVGCKKPNSEIYNLTLEKAGVLPEEAVFIDDMQRNIRAAIETGMHAIRFEDPGQALGNLSELLHS